MFSFRGRLYAWLRTVEEKSSVLLRIPSTAVFSGDFEGWDDLGDEVLLGILSKPYLTFSIITDPAVVQMDHAVGPTSGVGPVRDNYGRYIVQVLIETVEQSFFREFVERRRAFVQNEDLRML